MTDLERRAAKRTTARQKQAENTALWCEWCERTHVLGGDPCAICAGEIWLRRQVAIGALTAEQQEACKALLRELGSDVE